MGTRTNPGAFNCFAAALPDEPIFTILGRDPAGPATLLFWAEQRRAHGKHVSQDDRDRLSTAIDEASAMTIWRSEQIAFAALENTVVLWRLPRQTIDDRPAVAEVAARPEANTGPGLSGLPPFETFTFADTIQDDDDPAMADWKDKIASGPTTDPVFGESAHVAALKDRIRFLEAQLRVSPKPVDDLAQPPEVPPHRFSMFYKGERYAYARGLEVNPTHLPRALDEMAKDGWLLHCIFGETDSAKVGFIFEKGPRSRVGTEETWAAGGARPGELIPAIPNRTYDINGRLLVRITIDGLEIQDREVLARDFERLLMAYDGEAKFRVSIVDTPGTEAVVLFDHGFTKTGGHSIRSERTLWPCKPALQGCFDFGRGQQP